MSKVVLTFDNKKIMLFFIMYSIKDEQSSFDI